VVTVVQQSLHGQPGGRAADRGHRHTRRQERPRQRAGASGFVVKDTEPADLLGAIRIVARGDALLSPGVTRRLIADIAARPNPAAPAGSYHIDQLTDREREVLTLVGGGLSNDQIAAKLYVSPLTAKTHVSRIMTKLAARDRAQLVVVAYETGLVTPGGR
jgi:DNA-binding NarL/FixJ family response regulator